MENHFVDLRVRTEATDYAVVFSAKGGEVGHAFVSMVWGDEVAKATLRKGVGFYPGNSDKDFKAIFGADGQVFDDTWNQADLSLTVAVNQEAYEQAQSVVSRWEQPAPYFLGFRDCTTFVGEVSEAIGVVTVSRVFAPYPIQYVQALIDAN